MFDVGFSELVLCFIVALVVLGPQKLPAVARTLGRWTGRARMYVRNFSAELERAGVGDIRRDFDEAARGMRETAQSVQQDVRAIGDAARTDPQPGTRPDAGPDAGPKP